MSLFTLMVVVGRVSGVVYKSANDLVKIKNWSRRRSRKSDGIGVRRIRTFPFSFDSTLIRLRRLRSADDLVKTRLSELEAEVEG